MKSNHEFVDSPEFDEFFRRGDEPVTGGESIHPVVDDSHNDEELSRVLLRTPEQTARRAKFIRLVSAAMACLTLSSVAVFAYKAMAVRRDGAEAHLDAKPVVDKVDSLAVRVASAADRPSERAAGVTAASLPPSVSEPAPIAQQNAPVVAQPLAAMDQPEGQTKAPVEVQKTLEEKSDEHKAQEQVSGRPVVTASATPGAKVPSEGPAPPPVDAESRVDKHPSAAAASPPVVKVVPEVTAKVAPKVETRSSIVTAPPPTLKVATAVPRVEKKAAIVSTSTAVAARALARREKSQPSHVAVSKPAGPKPEIYHPPTASFSD